MGGITVAAAIIVGLVASFVQAIGLTIQRKSHLHTDALPPQQRKPPHRRPLWLVGFLIYITSNISSTLFQLDTLPIVILAPLGAVSLIFNALLARFVLADRFGVRAVLGTGLVAGGAVLIAVFGVVDESGRERGIDEVLRLWSRAGWVGWFSVMCVVIAIVLVLAHIAVWHTRRQLASPMSSRIHLGASTPPLPSAAPSNYASPHSPDPIPFRFTTTAPSPGITTRRWSSPLSSTSPLPSLTPHADPKHTSSTKLTISLPSPSLPPQQPTPTPSQSRTLLLSGLSFAACSGTLSGMSLLLAKAAVELLVLSLQHLRTGQGANQFAHPQTWFLVVGLAVAAILQLVYLNYALALASPALVCPLAFCFFNLSSIFDGLIFYEQLALLAPVQIALVSLGVAVLLLGVWVVSAVQTDTGEGGVDIGTWIEDESECGGDDEPLLGGPHTAEPDPTSPVLEQSIFSPVMPSPMSPSSPMSPTARKRHRTTRYGTLMGSMDLGGDAAPAGFSIGIGAASPGFMLRHASGGHHHGHQGEWARGRSRSDGQHAFGAAGSGGVAGLMGGGPDEALEGESGRENQAERTLRDWADGPGETDREGAGGWWRRLFGRSSSKGKIRLEEEEGS